jgi:uncharacterized repeat protein (TIGR01451 family)
MRALRQGRIRSSRREEGNRRLTLGVSGAKVVLAVVLSAALLGSGLSAVTLLAGATDPAAAAPGSPGTPQAGSVVFSEDFENTPGATPQVLTDYTGADGQTYTAADSWLTNCNGQVVNFDIPSTTLGNCAIEGDAAHLRQLAYALGVHAGSATPGANDAVSAYTEGNPGANQVEFQTTGNIPLASASGRFLTFSVDAAAFNCGVSAPLYQFAFLDESGTASNVGSAINACTSSTTVPVPAKGPAVANTVNVGTYTSNGSVLFTGSTLGLRMTNANGSGVGNDAAFDNIRILDVTPQLDKAFSPASIRIGQTSTLTFTITNTTELAAKNGWSFSDALPAGLTVASPSAASTTCPSGVVTATAGGGTVAASGNLAAGMASCTVSVSVEAAATGNYTNGPANVTPTGLNAPGDATLEVTDPPTWECSAFGYLFQTPDPDTHQMIRVDLVSGAATPIGTTPDNVNAVGYNTLDDYMYGWGGSVDHGSLLRVASDGSFTDLGRPAGTPANLTFQVGDFDAAGHLYLQNGGFGTLQWIEVDLAPGSPTYAKIIASGTATRPAGIGAMPSDWTYVNGSFYGLADTSAGTGTARLIRFNATTHVTSNLGAVANTAGNATYGAAYADAGGNLYFSNNATGVITRVNPQTRASIQVSTGPSSGGNDGARCATAPIPTITVVKNVAGRAQAADQFTVGLRGPGGAVLTSATTAGADTTVSTTDWPVSQGRTYTITDAMAAGSPDAFSSYSAVVECVDGSGAPVTTGGTTGAWTLTVANADAYTCTITNAPNTPAYTVSKTASAATVAAGGVLTYTVTVTNTGTVPYTAANPASFSDDLSGVLDDASYNGDATGGATVIGSTLRWSGALAVGATRTVTYSVTADNPDTGDRSMTNSVVPGDGGSCDPAGGCTTTTPVQSLTITKTADTDDVVPGDTITYTITVANTGEVDYTAADPASLTDDLSAVLDDAVYNDDATGGATYAAPTLSWSGPLAAGATQTITYSVTVADPDDGDSRLTNAVVSTSPGTNCAAGSDDPACTVQIPSGSFTVVKTASSTEANPGDVVTYTVTVANTGTIDYTAADPASFSDNLAGVLDDASYNGDASNGATLSGTTLSWSGPVAVGGSITITYSVTVDDPDDGDRSLANTVRPTSPGGICTTSADCAVTTPIQSFTVAKSASSAQAAPGSTIVYTVTVTNTGTADYTAGTPASFSDDLSAVLDDATYAGDATGGATVAGDTLIWAGPLAVGAVATITYSVTVDDPDTGDGVLTNAVVPGGDGGDCAAGACTTTTSVQSFSLTKAASATRATPGSTVTYTVTVTNTGQTAYTDASPASFTDDLSSVLDDAVYNDDATTGAVVDGATLTWQGPLAVGATTTITYSVTVNDPDTGDHSLDNAVTPTGPGGDCATAADCATTTAVQSYTVAKTSAPAGNVTPGSVVTYTVTVVNTGTVDYTDGDPAAFDDDLSAVLDDASYNGDATGGATFDAPTLSWSGALAAGATQTVTYSVTVGAAGSGDGVLTNAVDPTGSGGGCLTADDCATTNQLRAYSVSKTASPSGAVTPGTEVAYTVTVTNTGTADYTADDPASFTDDLTAVLDDASYNGDATGGATYAAPVLSWSGALPVGATQTVTYSVTVKGSDLGDGTLTNAVEPGDDGGACASDCSTTNPVQSYTIAKTASTTQLNPGETVEYTVTVANTGQVAYTAADPASFTDDLTGVLDDAVYNGDASNGATVAGVTLSWSGALAVGATRTITYSVTVKDPDNGDHVVANAIDPTGRGGLCAGEGDCTTTTAVQSYRVTKTADATQVIPGDTIIYTVTVVNTGTADYTADDPAMFSDDLSGVLDDATYNDDATGGATYSAPVLTWSGALAVGQTVTVTYSVTVNLPDEGDALLPNAVLTGDGGNCAVGSDDPACVVQIPSGSYTVAKAASATTVDQDGTITYTVTVTNTGQLDYTAGEPASFSDDLSSVLDDATYNGDAGDGATLTGTTLSWSGPLAVGATTTITYSVTADNPDVGDRMLNNFVRPTSPGGACADDCSTSTPVRALEATKTVDSDSSAPGRTLTYTITVTNTGAADYTAGSPARFTDDLSSVLDDAAYDGDATGGATFAAPELTWSGPLAVGETETVTYSVTVDDPDRGDRVIRNAVLTPGGNCTAGGDDPACSTTTTVAVPPILAATGLGDGQGLAGLSALALIAAGLGIVFGIRRRRDAQ